MNEETYTAQYTAPHVVTRFLHEFSAILDYQTLKRALAQRLPEFLHCSSAFLYLYTVSYTEQSQQEETLSFVFPSQEEYPDLAVFSRREVASRSIRLESNLPEIAAWREQRTLCLSHDNPTRIIVPLVYRQRSVGVLVSEWDEGEHEQWSTWYEDRCAFLEAIASAVALLLESTRLFEKDRERIHELSLLNSMSSQLNNSMYEFERLRNVVIQRTQEIASVDFCDIVESTHLTTSWLSSDFCILLSHHFHTQHAFTPFVLQRSDVDQRKSEYFAYMPEHLDTFFALPLLRGRTLGPSGRPLARSNRTGFEGGHESSMLGMIVGGYTHPHKLRQAEMTLLQVLASQASSVWENMRLMDEVLEARNEARGLLRQVVDDQRFKERILESIPSGLITIDMQGCIHTFNRAAATILGYHPYEVLGYPLRKYLPIITESGMHVNTGDTSSCDVVGGEEQAHQRTVVTTDRYERERVLEMDNAPLYNDQGERIGKLITFNDVTSMHQLEEEKRRLDRLASLGEMAASVAHEVRNPLASIKTSIQMVHADLASDEVVEREQREAILESMSIMLKEVERLDTIVHDLLLFARPRQLQRVRCNLALVCDQVLNMLQKQCEDANIAVHRIYEDVSPILADMGQMEQVVFNLLTNALHAMPDGGIVTIACRRLSPRPTSGIRGKAHEQPFVHTSFQEGPEQEATLHTAQQGVELSVSDTGIGIGPEQLEHIFQPFYTTKAHGIGLGLAITRRLVEDHGGTIAIESQLGYGTTIRIQLMH